jgi:hypothetical protein
VVEEAVYDAMYAASATGPQVLANGAITDASLAGNMEIVFETDFGTNYNTTRNAWATNAQDFVGTTAADPFNGQIVAASVTTKTGYTLTNLTDASAGKLDDMLDGTGGVTISLAKVLVTANDADGGIYVENSGGPGISTVGTRGFNAIGNSQSGCWIQATAGNTAGFYTRGSGTGADIDGDMTGNITGNLSGSVASVTTGPTVIKAAAATGTLSTTQCTSTLTHADDRLVGRKIVFTAGTASGQAGLITGYANASGLVTWIPAMAIAPADGDTFEIHDFDSGLITRAATYQAGAIWIDTTNGAAGTVDYVNGTSTNPTDSIADANTLATSVGIVRFNVAPASSITLAASQDNQIFTGSAWFLVLNGQSVNLSTFEGAVVTGTGTGIGTWNNCVFGTCTLGGAAVFRDCVLGDSFFGGTITLGSAAVYTFLNCTSSLPGPVGVTIDFGAAIGNSTVNLAGFEGSVTIANLGATGTDVLVVTGDCEVTLAASCTGGTVFLNGNIGFTNNGSGQTIYQDARFELSRILSDSTAFDGADIAAILLDTGTTLPTTLTTIEGKVDTVDTVADAIKVITDALTAAAATKLALSAGTIVAGTVSHDNTAASTTVFYANDITEAIADHYNGRIVIFTSGALQYQATDITDYALESGEGKFTVTALTSPPADNVTFIIV